jgi:hypothetical protein
VPVHQGLSPREASTTNLVVEMAGMRFHHFGRCLHQEGGFLARAPKAETQSISALNYSLYYQQYRKNVARLALAQTAPRLDYELQLRNKAATTL